MYPLNSDDAILATAEEMIECAEHNWAMGKHDHNGFGLDGFASIHKVSAPLRRHLQAAADLADLAVEITKVGDQARVRFL